MCDKVLIIRGIGACRGVLLKNTVASGLLSEGYY